ncbi:MAG: FHA domain-containing protein [Ruminococcaceae bacterium]|nr:FHA domain-containing protein [Oscillospiraceae bacterium]
MKTKRILQIVTVMFLLAVFAVCLPTTADAAQDPPIYLLEYNDGSGYIWLHCSLISDGGIPYLVTIPGADVLESQGLSPRMYNNSVSVQPTYGGSNGIVASYSAPELANVSGMQVGTAFSSTCNAYLLDMNSDGQLSNKTLRLTIDSSWVVADSCIYSSQTEAVSSKYWGAPVINDSGEVVGILTGTDTNKMAVIPLADYSNVLSGSGSNGGQNQTPQNPQNGGEGSDGEGSNGEGTEGEGITKTITDNGWIILLLLGGGGAAAGIAISKNKNKSDNNLPTEEGNNDTLDADMMLTPEPTVGVAPVIAPAPAPAPATGGWQIRGIGGPMDGRVFLINDQLRLGRGSACDVPFSQNAGGISAQHCLLRIVDGRVVLQDLRSTYGTYMAGKKLEPQVEYQLHTGDEFTMANGGQTFRLERAGAVANLGPAVRNVSSGNTHRADMDGRIAFGRAESSQVIFERNDTSISTRHCVLYREGVSLFLMDTNSSNGTFLENGKRLRPNVPYPVKKGQSFYLTAPKNTFVITED